MGYFLAQLMVLGRNGDFEGWVQLLVLAIIIVGYVISGILKAASKKKEETEGEKQQKGQPRPAGPAVRRQFRTAPQPQRAKVSRPEPVLPGYGGLRPDERKLAEAEKAAQQKEKKEVQYPDTLWLDISDPEEIRKAILHYEIIGKPMSLRGSDEQIIGL